VLTQTLTLLWLLLLLLAQVLWLALVCLLAPAVWCTT
jgi:hypothetical protein